MTLKPAEFARTTLEPLLTVDDLERLLQVDRRTIARLCKRGQLPPPLKLGGGNRWREQDIVDAISVLDERRDRRTEKSSLVAV